MSTVDKKEIALLIDEAIMRERKRITDIIDNSTGYYYDNGTIDWNRTARNLAIDFQKGIRKNL